MGTGNRLFFFLSQRCDFSFAGTCIPGRYSVSQNSDAECGIWREGACLRVGLCVCVGVMALRGFVSEVDAGSEGSTIQPELNPPHCQFIPPNLDRLRGLAAKRFYSDHLQLLIRSFLNNNLLNLSLARCQISLGWKRGCGCGCVFGYLDGVLGF